MIRRMSFEIDENMLIGAEASMILIPIGYWMNATKESAGTSDCAHALLEGGGLTILNRLL